MTAVPKDTSLGLTRWMRIARLYLDPATRRANRLKKPPVATPASLDFRPMAAPADDQDDRESAASTLGVPAGGASPAPTALGGTARSKPLAPIVGAGLAPPTTAAMSG